MAVWVKRRLELEDELEAALAGDQLHLELQPQISILTGELVGAEALARWQHPTLGEIPPDIFVPLAEETGRIPRLGQLGRAPRLRARRAVGEGARRRDPAVDQRLDPPDPGRHPGRRHRGSARRLEASSRAAATGDHGQPCQPPRRQGAPVCRGARQARRRLHHRRLRHRLRSARLPGAQPDPRAEDRSPLDRGASRRPHLREHRLGGDRAGARPRAGSDRDRRRDAGAARVPGAEPAASWRRATCSARRSRERRSKDCCSSAASFRIADVRSPGRRSRSVRQRL